MVLVLAERVLDLGDDRTDVAAELLGPRIWPRAVRTRETDSSLGVPSGRRAGMSTALCRAKTPGAGSGALIGPSLIRLVASSRWVGLGKSRSRWARTIAPSAAVMSSAPVISNAQT